jgi:hypothetical protein
MLAYLKSNRLYFIFLTLAAALCIGSAVYIVTVGLVIPIGFIAIGALILLEIWYIQNPKAVVWATLTYGFLMMFFQREIGHIPWGTLQEGVIGLGFLTLLFTWYKYDWKRIRNDFFYLTLAWFILSFLEVANPQHAALQGWIQEIRSAALYPLVVVTMGFILLKNNRDLNTFLLLIIIISLIATVNGMKQLYIHPSPGEQRFLDEGGAVTHILWGKLRVFSFYSDAGQFGASQAHIALICIILALGPYKPWKKICLFIVGMIIFWGMLISGTRGALVGIVVGGLVALLLSKNFKALLIGGIVLGSFLGFLKYTKIGDNVYQIYRLRTALDPQEASLNVRITNQAKIRAYLADKPLGAGLGTLGDAGLKYNGDKYISTIPPDSYWVKVWAMYGIVGFTIWFGIMMYMLGKSAGIIWKLEDPGLRVKMIALTAGFAGILFCSYGNEVINTAPSSYIVYISWVLVAMGPQLDKEIREHKLKAAHAV